MKYEEAKKRADAAEKKLYESADPMSSFEMKVISDFKRHCVNHFDELLEALKNAPEIYAGVDGIGFECTTPYAKELIAKCEEVEGI